MKLDAIRRARAAAKTDGLQVALEVLAQCANLAEAENRIQALINERQR